jgi:hypothetical protein
MIKDALETLSQNDRELLMYSLNEGLSHYVELPNNRFIGVNINNPNFNIEEEKGAWSYGEIVR